MPVRPPPCGSFLRAANGGGLASQVTFLYIVYWPLIFYISSLQQTRALLAMSFDGVLPKGIRVNRYGCPWFALVLAALGSTAVFVYAVINQTSFFQTLIYALVVQLIAMGLVGLSAVLAPIVKPALYRASTSQKEFLGIPLVQIAGAGAIVVCVFAWWAYMYYDSLGTNGGIVRLLGWTAGPEALGAIFYFAAAAYKHSKGKDITLVYKEIPTE